MKVINHETESDSCKYYLKTEAKTKKRQKKSIKLLVFRSMNVIHLFGKIKIHIDHHLWMELASLFN